jgi:DNA-binding response OmpR family regulator
MVATRPRERARILIVDDDTTVAEILSRYLLREGYEVESVADGQLALERTRAHMPDLVVLDLMLPRIDGLAVCRRLRTFTQVPIIMLTARGEELERIFGLRLGADDYVVKPFSPREVTARVNSVLRRSGAQATCDEPDVLAAGGVELNLRAHTAHADGQPVALPAREFELLAFLMRRPNEAFSREQLLEHVWGYRFGETATVTVHVRRIRQKIEPDPNCPTRLQTVWGVGYRFAC